MNLQIVSDDDVRKDACRQRVVTTYLHPFTTSELGREPHNVSHQNCRHSVIDAMKRRHYKLDLPYPSTRGLTELNKALTWLKKLCRQQGIYPGSIERWSPEQVVATRAPAKKATYARAFRSLEQDEISTKDAFVKAFIKHEKGPQLVTEFDGEAHKPSRLIQHRDERFCAQLATFLAPLEHELYKLEYHGTRIYGKSLNQYQTADEIVKADDTASRYFMLDHSAFDSHISGELLNLEHQLYLWVFQNDPELKQMLDLQTNNRVYLTGGFRFDTIDLDAAIRKWVIFTKDDSYTFKKDTPERLTYLIREYIEDGDTPRKWPGRMSGDFNTGLGNSIINSLVLYAFGARNLLNNNPCFRFCVNGDDCWGTIPLDFTMPSYEQFREWGMTTKLEGEALSPEGVQYCQARPVLTSHGWMMVRDFRRVLNRLPYTIRRYSGKAWDAYARGVADCELALGLGIPVLDAIARSLDKQFADVKAPLVDRSDEYSYILARQVKDNRTITSAARISYALAFDITPQEQEILEARILQHNWRISPADRDGP